MLVVSLALERTRTQPHSAVFSCTHAIHSPSPRGASSPLIKTAFPPRWRSIQHVGWVAVGPDGAPSAESAAAGAERFGRLARQWAADGAVLIGGCCRTRPDHIAAVARELRAAEEEGRHRHGTTLLRP